MTPFAAIDSETAGYDAASVCSPGIAATNADGSSPNGAALSGRSL